MIWSIKQEGLLLPLSTLISIAADISHLENSCNLKSLHKRT